jgi:hypothetical protein
MSQPINDGGPAFPVVFQHDEATSECHGISIRDYFAAAALQGQAHRFAHPHEYRELLAQDCYDIADAMLKAREVKP